MQSTEAETRRWMEKISAQLDEVSDQVTARGELIVPEKTLKRIVSSSAQAIQKALDETLRKALSHLMVHRGEHGGGEQVNDSGPYISQSAALKLLGGLRTRKTLQRMRESKKLRFKAEAHGKSLRIYYVLEEIRALKLRISGNESS